MGVIVAKVDSVTLYQNTGQVVRDIGLAMPADRLEAFLSEHGIDYQVANDKAAQPGPRVLEEARPFLVQIGCWR